jgi:hypothetical protein
MTEIIEMKIRKDHNEYYTIYINDKRMPELYNRLELMRALNYFTKIWSNEE